MAERVTLPGPFPVFVVEDLRHCAPTHIFDQRRFFILYCRSRLVFQLPDNLNSAKVLLKLLLRTACAQAVVVGDAIVVEVFWRVFLLAAVR
jgi:hypothetical protein